jgi:hypothetical protein
LLQASRIAIGNGSNEQMFGAKQQVLHCGRSDQETVIRSEQWTAKKSSSNGNA